MSLRITCIADITPFHKTEEDEERKMAVMENSKPTVEINALKFTYPGIDGHPPPGSTPLINDFTLTLNAGDRCLLVGSNGAGLFHFSSSFTLIVCHKLKKNDNYLFNRLNTGKTTILKIIGGKHMVEPEMVKVLGRSAFHDTALTSSGDLSYLGGEVGYFYFSF